MRDKVMVMAFEEMSVLWGVVHNHTYMTKSTAPRTEP